MLNTQPQMRVLLGVLWWSGCSPEQIPPGPKSVSTTGPEYAQFKQDVDRSFSILDWNDMRIDWRHFDAAAMYVRTATGRGGIQEKFFETIGLAHRIPIFDLSFMKIIQLLSLAGLSFPV